MLNYKSGLIEAKLDKTRKMLVEDVSFSIDSGETLALVGETGSGKTIIACSIMELLPENVVRRGAFIEFSGKKLPSVRDLVKLLGNEIVYIPQSGLECLNQSLVIEKHFEDSMKKLGVPSSERRERYIKALMDVGFTEPEEILKKYPFELSGGMGQRVVIALASCSNAKLVIADEPTNGIEEESKFEFLDLMQRLFPSAAKLVITHDISVARTCDRVLVLCKGREMECGPSGMVLESPRSPYTKALLASLVENGMHAIPRLRKDRGFCPFYQRCSLAGDACQSSMKLNEDENVRWYCNNA